MNDKAREEEFYNQVENIGLNFEEQEALDALELEKYEIDCKKFDEENERYKIEFNRRLEEMDRRLEEMDRVQELESFH